MGAELQQQHERRERREGREPVIVFDDVRVELEGRLVLENISFRVDAGEFLGVVGPNGAGKTTLLKVLLGLLPIAGGSVLVFGRPPGGQARQVGYVPQRTAVGPHFPATVTDVVMMGRLCRVGPFRLVRAADRREVARALDLVGMQDRAERPVGRLSGGELRRVILAQALCAGARLLVLDEPTIGLDLPSELEFYALLARLQSELGLTVICVSHDLVALGGQADKLICINRRMHVHGNPEDVVHSHALREAYSCEFDFLAGEIAHHDGHGHAH